MPEADKALRERTQNALEQCLAWLERDALIDAHELQALVRIAQGLRRTPPLSDACTRSATRTSTSRAETRIREADTAFLERTQNALDHWLVWLEREARIDAYQHQQGGRP